MNKELFNQGFIIKEFPLTEKVLESVNENNWKALDNEFLKLTQKDGLIFNFLRQFHEFNQIEFIISIRDALDPDQEDGIWHDDGSRLMAFSLSLTQHPFEGGLLEFKNNSKNFYTTIKTPEFGKGIIFLTGEYGYLHKINQVTRGKRIIIAGWCS